MKLRLRLGGVHFQTMFKKKKKKSSREHRLWLEDHFRKSDFSRRELQVFRLLCKFLMGNTVKFGIRFPCNQFEFLFICFLILSFIIKLRGGNFTVKSTALEGLDAMEPNS